MIVADVDDSEYTKKKIQDTLVPTLDTVRYKYMMDLCIKHSRFAGLFHLIIIIIIIIWDDMTIEQVQEIGIRTTVITKEKQSSCFNACP